MGRLSEVVGGDRTSEDRSRDTVLSWRGRRKRGESSGEPERLRFKECKVDTPEESCCARVRVGAVEVEGDAPAVRGVPSGSVRRPTGRARSPASWRAVRRFGGGVGGQWSGR